MINEKLNRLNFKNHARGASGEYFRKGRIIIYRGDISRKYEVFIVLGNAILLKDGLLPDWKQLLRVNSNLTDMEWLAKLDHAVNDTCLCASEVEKSGEIIGKNRQKPAKIGKNQKKETTTGERTYKTSANLRNESTCKGKTS
ncbi:MAG: hypothetical protein ACLFQU_13245 [Candidatus Kapaibacterium sp.]